MERLKVTKSEEEYPSITLSYNDEVSLSILFAGNLDLYFMLAGAHKSQKFIIDESNLRVYDIFNKLYNDLINCKLPFESDKEKLRRLTNYDLLVQNNIITWRSDDYPFDIGPSFKIEKVDEKFVITFDRGKEEEYMANKYSISVRIRNSGSFYRPFNANFMTLYHELCNLDLKQMYIDEIMDLRRIKK